MKKLYAILTALIIISCNNEDENLQKQPETNNYFSKKEINEKIITQIKQKGTFSWASFNNDEALSAFNLSDGEITVAWDEYSADDKEKDVLINFVKKSEGDLFDEKNTIVRVNTNLNYMVLKVENPKTFLALRQHKEAFSVELQYQPYTKEDVVIAENTNIQKSTPSSDNITQYQNHSISAAWNSHITGDNIKVAVLDGGLLPNDITFGQNGTFVSNSLRTIEKLGFYNEWWYLPWTDTDGPYEDDSQYQSGHGTTMAKIIGGPDNSDFKGIAYECDLVSVRTSWSVWIDSPSSSLAVADAYEYLSGRSDIKIISMSQGGILNDEPTKRAIRRCYNNGKLIFAAAGTFYIPGVQQYLSESAGFTLFPARMNEVIACTAVKNLESTNGIMTWCDAAFGISDFVCEFDNGGASSQATASTAAMAALIWSKYPYLTRDQVLQKMKESSDWPTIVNPNFGHGRIDMQKFINNNLL